MTGQCTTSTVFERHGRRARAALLLFCLVAGSLGLVTGATNEAGANAVSKRDHFFSYTNDVIAEVPWSVHVAKIDRSRSDWRFCTTVGKGDALGMATVSEQLRTLLPELGQPLVAINGDFYDKSETYPGRPRDLQIRQGELISSPAGHTCFWIDTAGMPQMTNVFSKFQVTWADGKSTPLGLNEERADDAAVLYTSVVGPSTRTRGGAELVLESANGNLLLPLRVGQTYEARVQSRSEGGNSPLKRNGVVLSLGPKLIPRLPSVGTGTLLKIGTHTLPELAGIEVAIGGGPALVRDGKVMEWKGFIHMRHPRTALGWNSEHIFLVEVDGRQSDLSVGMTFPELAAYLVKLGCVQAMNLDGGGSATFWVLGSVRNSPSEGQERPAPNALVLMKTKNPPGQN